MYVRSRRVTSLQIALEQVADEVLYPEPWRRRRRRSQRCECRVSGYGNIQHVTHNQGSLVAGFLCQGSPTIISILLMSVRRIGRKTRDTLPKRPLDAIFPIHFVLRLLICWAWNADQHLPNMSRLSLVGEGCFPVQRAWGPYWICPYEGTARTSHRELQ